MISNHFIKRYVLTPEARAMTSLNSTSPLLSTTTTLFAAATPRVNCTMNKVNTLSTMGGLRLVAKIQVSKASRSSLPFFLCSETSTISCSPETLKIVQTTIAKQLSIDESTVTPNTKFADLGADSLDTVEIMMALEEKFEVSIGEDGAQNITTVEDAADLIEKVKADSA